MNYLTKENGLLSWLLTGDHKRIAILYLISITLLLLYRRFACGPDPPGIADAAKRSDGHGHL